VAKKNPNFSKKLLTNWSKDEQKFINFFCKEFPKTNLNELTNKQLAKFWLKSYYLFSRRTTSSAIIDHFALGSDQLISNMLRKEIFGSRSPAGFKESQFTEIFSTATAPVHQSFINLAEIELLKIILGKSTETLQEYQKRWYWSKNNYVTSQILSKEHFEQEIKIWKKSSKNLAKELKRIEETPHINKLKKQNLFKKIKLSPLLHRLLKISEDFTWWQDERKKATYFNIDIGCKILSEVSRRTGYSLNELKYAYPAEVKDIIFKHSPSRKELQQRHKNSALIAVEGSFQVLTGKKVSELKKIVLGNKLQDQIKDFRGLSASTGRAIGPVKIVKSATEIGKVKQGDILVAVMTRPDYIAGMKKAAAIVTNEGGITSHAAIVSRELSIPCIIGTKIATEVLKDGDMVEVNADHGWVRKIK
jgi:phosphohistidine swiveling domain-containing protein